MSKEALLTEKEVNIFTGKALVGGVNQRRTDGSCNARR